MEEMRLVSHGWVKPRLALTRENEEQIVAVLRAMDEWLSNEQGLMIEDVIEWRDALAVALGKAKGSWFTECSRPMKP